MNVRGGRALLNQPGHESTAAIVAEIEDTREWLPGKGSNGKAISHRYHCEPNMKFQIANCDRSLEFTFGFDPEHHENNLYKIETLISVLIDFQEALADEQERYVERLDAFDKKRKRRDSKRRKQKREESK